MEENKKTTAVIVERGNYYFGHNTRDSSGTVTKHTPSKWEADPDGSAIVVSAFDTKKGEPIGKADIFAAWDSIGVDRRVREKLELKRRNFPTPEELYRWIKAWEDRGIDLCEICEGPFAGYDCSICPINFLKLELEE